MSQNTFNVYKDNSFGQAPRQYQFRPSSGETISSFRNSNNNGGNLLLKSQKLRQSQNLLSRSNGFHSVNQGMQYNNQGFQVIFFQ